MKLLAACAFAVLCLCCTAANPHASAWRITATTKAEAKLQTAAAGHATTARAISLDGQHTSAEQLWWADYKQHFNKRYESKTAEQAAFKYFKASLERVRKVNLDDTKSWWASPNWFSDRSPEQISKILMSPQEVAKVIKHQKAKPLQAGNVTKQHRRSLQGIPGFIDWKKAGKVMPAKSQGDCGGCWAYAGTTAIESAYLIHAGKKTWDVPNPFLSVNQLLNCANSGAGYYSSGCGGGNQNDAFDYVNRNGLGTDSAYNYQGCGANSVQTTVGNTMVAPANSEYALKQVVAKQPVVAFFAVGQDFMDYVGGTYQAYGCGGSVNHALTLYGYDDSQGHWRVMNSWGGDWWGESGTAKIAYTGDGQGPCQMYTYASYPSLSFSRNYRK